MSTMDLSIHNVSGYRIREHEVGPGNLVTDIVICDEKGEAVFELTLFGRDKFPVLLPWRED